MQIKFTLKVPLGVTGILVLFFTTFHLFAVCTEYKLLGYVSDILQDKGTVQLLHK